MTLVSVLMPAYRHERFVARAVESVLGQTHGDLELVVIDDASPDGTWDVLAAFQDGRLRRQRHEVNRGAHATLNEALAQARGDYVAILNSDDIYHPRRIERLLAEAATRRDGAGLIFSDVEFIDQDSRLVPDHPRAADYAALRDFCRDLPPKAWFFAGNPAISTSNLFFARHLVDRVGEFAPLRYTHDWDWILRAAGCGPVGWVREPLLQYRVHPANTLSEDDRWRHVHENSCVQARALLGLFHEQETFGSGELPLALARSLLRNESLHPAALVYFLAYGLGSDGDARLLAAATATPDSRPWLLETVAAADGYPPALFDSLRQWIEHDQEIAAQAAMLDERWQTIQHMSGEIADRDTWIADLKALLEDRERSIAGQAALIEERWNAIQHMNGEIANRDRQISELEAMTSSLRTELAQLKGKWLVRLARRLDRLHAFLGGGR